MRRNIAGQAIGAQLINKTDGSAATTGTTTVYVTGDAGTQIVGSVGSGVCVHEGNGYWTYGPATNETDFDQVSFTFVNSLAITATIQVYTTATSGPTTAASTGPTASTYDFTLTRDRLIEMAHQVIGVLEPGQALDSEQLQDGKDLLGLIVRETDASGKWLWTINAASHMTLAASTHRYDSANGLPVNIADLLTALYRDAQGRDTPLKIIKSEQYESIKDKMGVGTPQYAYVVEHRDLASRSLFLYPMLSTVVTGSVVTGTDAIAYKCIYPHRAATVTKPITGANYKMAWEVGGSGPSTWTLNTDYTCTEQLRLTYRRPIFDFDTAADTPDFPLEWPRTILYKLAFDLGDIYSIPLEERQMMVQKAKAGFSDIYQNVKAKSQSIHHKTSFF
jgi:hypothetical protein